ncbi:vancomycin permeability regulator SanA [Actinoplanes tereljensis]|uniref:SanA protein n=1 Tax=Paractinoplanes tereljensis TaxID=571912 RepID=A0A919TQH8_9ACTN|nr:ElyC/SanA/YdcF family protein [Actinoplanes tereljensis]GIF18169.1 SanA protein [Actinoplanes tereljensis]
MKIKRVAVAAVAAVLAVSSPWAWTSLSAQGHVYAVSKAPAADVAIVLGTEVVNGEPSPRLRGRLEAAADLVSSGKARVLLVSGDGNGGSGDEPAAMTAYLVSLGVPVDRIVGDPHGLDTYDTCIRARDVYGVKRALVVTQSYHVDRAVTLCRHLDIDADGVVAPCHCSWTLRTNKSIRDYLASGKAAWDAVRNRPPAVTSPPDPAIENALRS